MLCTKYNFRDKNYSHVIFWPNLHLQNTCMNIITTEGKNASLHTGKEFDNCNNYYNRTHLRYKDIYPYGTENIWPKKMRSRGIHFILCVLFSEINTAKMLKFPPCILSGFSISKLSHMRLVRTVFSSNFFPFPTTHNFHTTFCVSADHSTKTFTKGMCHARRLQG